MKGSVFIFKKKGSYSHPYKGPITNTCKGGLMQKIFIMKIFRGPPLDLKKFQGPPFCQENYGSTPYKSM